MALQIQGLVCNLPESIIMEVINATQINHQLTRWSSKNKQASLALWEWLPQECRSTRSNKVSSLFHPRSHADPSRHSFRRISDSGASALQFHVQDLPEVATLALILCSSVACPPVLVRFPVVSVLHVWPQNRRNATLAPRRASRVKIRTIKPKRDVDSAIRRLRRR